MRFTREQWATLRANTPLLLDEDELRRLRGLNEPMPVDEVADIYLPLSRLINLYVEAARDLLQVTDRFLGRPSLAPPFVVAIAGSVAAGKSTTARVLRALLARWPAHPTVELVTTDGFLHPNAELEARGLMQRKGFPESYDVARLLRFLTDLKSGKAEIHAPVYSHLVYDVVAGAHTTVRRPDVLILEGINVLQAPSASARDAQDGRPRLMVSDFIDFSIYVDADESSLRAVVRAPLPPPARHGLPRSRVVLPPVRGAVGAGRDDDGDAHLARHQPREPRAEHRGDARARVGHPAQGAGARGGGGAPASRADRPGEAEVALTRRRGAVGSTRTNARRGGEHERSPPRRAFVRGQAERPPTS